jgi:hypothetical protein
MTPASAAQANTALTCRKRVLTLVGLSDPCR